MCDAPTSSRAAGASGAAKGTSHPASSTSCATQARHIQILTAAANCFCCVCLCPQPTEQELEAAKEELVNEIVTKVLEVGHSCSSSSTAHTSP